MKPKMTTDEYLARPEAMVRRELVWGVVREPPVLPDFEEVAAGFFTVD